MRQAVAREPVAGGVAPACAFVAEPAGVHDEQLGADRRGDVDLGDQARFVEFMLHVRPVVVDHRLEPVADGLQDKLPQVGVQVLDCGVKLPVAQAEVDLRRLDRLAGGDDPHRGRRVRAQLVAQADAAGTVVVVAEERGLPVRRPAEVSDEATAVEVVPGDEEGAAAAAVAGA